MVDRRSGQTSGGTQQPSAAAVVVSVETTITAEDIAAAWSCVPLFRVGWRVYVWMTLSGVGFIVLAFFQGGGPGWGAVLGMVLGNLLVMWLGVSVKRGWIRGTANQWSGPARFRFDQAGFQLETPTRHVQLAWTAVPQYVETPRAFLVYAAEHGFALLPKRACETGEIDSVRQMLAAHVARTPRRGSGRPLLVGVVLVIFLVVWQAMATVSEPPHDDGEPSLPAETH